MNDDDCIPIGNYKIRVKTDFELIHGENPGLRFLPEFYLTDDHGTAYQFMQSWDGRTTFKQLKGKEAETAASYPEAGTLEAGDRELE